MSGLYAIVDPRALGARDPVRFAAAVLAGGCARLQLRHKAGSDRALLELARALKSLCAERGVPFVVNDRADVAQLTGADGLHLGQDDLPLADARALLPDAEIGLSTHDPAQARAATDADLVAFGPIFATTSKEAPDPVVGLDALGAICANSPRPVVAIGGIDLARAPQIREAGATYGAVIGALAKADDPTAAARALHAALGGES